MFAKFLHWLDNVPLLKAPAYFLLLVGVLLAILTVIL